MIQINNATILYDKVPLFAPFHLHLKEKEIGCITGPSGMGKTSLLRAIMGFVPLHTGTIFIRQQEMTPATIQHLRQQIAWIPQEINPPVEWVKELIEELLFLRNNTKRLSLDSYQIKKKVIPLFEQLDLPISLFEQRVSELSGGQRQRILLIIATLLQKPLIIMDEPTSALDEHSTALVMSYIQELCSAGSTFLCVSHSAQFKTICHQEFPLQPTL